MSCPLLPLRLTMAWLPTKVSWAVRSHIFHLHRNLGLEQLIKPNYRLEDLAEIEQFLEQHHTLDLYPVANHLYAAATGLSSQSTTGYQDVWLRDNRSEERRVGKECRSRWSPYH